MGQRSETSEVLEGFDKAKAEGRQPTCPYCHKPLEIGQFYSVYIQWTWNDKKKGYEQKDQDWDGDTPFCDACETQDWDFTDNDLMV